MWTLIILAALCLIGLVVCLLMLGLKPANSLLYGNLILAFLGAGTVFGLLGGVCYRRTDRLSVAELDALELEDDENSFFVGEGTLATFKKDSLYIHGGIESKKSITVPYYDIKFYSVCTRRAPREKGEWSVVLEIPSRYFNKGGMKTASNILIQTSGKERLYSRLNELGLELIGEMPQKETSEHKFQRLRKFVLANSEKRLRALILAGLGAALIIGGIFASIYWMMTIGSVIIILGAYMGIRALIAYFRAKAEFSVYEEGIFYREPTGVDNAFLKWTEFSSINIQLIEGKEYLRVTCPYGAYDFPLFEGAYEYIKERYPDKCAE